MLDLHVLVALAASFAIRPCAGMTSYANEFFSPETVLDSSWVADAKWAQSNTVEDAEWIAAQGPWTVTSKPILPPSNNSHDYASLRPYYWPDCSSVGNTTELTDEQIYTTCPYVRRDGDFNPDARMINDTGAFSAMSDSVLYNSLAWSFTRRSTYASAIVSAISTWFLDPSTLMNPHLEYSQLLRGPGEQKGSSVGVLDLKCMSKVVSGVLVLRRGGAPEWTTALDDGLNEWVKEYIVWLTTSPLALTEKAASNNHGSFYFNQLASLQVLVGDTASAKATIEEYFTGIFQDQIAADGDQPLETARTRPYHYRAYNLAAMVVNAKIGEYVGMRDAWNRTARSGGGIRAAADYAMGLPAGEEELGAVTELLQPLAAVASVYGDADGKYAAFLKSKDDEYPSRGYYLLASGLSDSGLTPAAGSGAGSASPPAATPGVGATNGTTSLASGATRDAVGRGTGVAAAAALALCLCALFLDI